MDEYLNTLLSTLNTIEVKGKENMNLLLGAILATEQMISQLGKEADDAEHPDDNS